MHSVSERAVDALFVTLADGLPGALAALDAERKATIRCRTGPYTFTGDRVVTINGESFIMPEGSRHASWAASTLSQGESFTASIEYEGTPPLAPARLVLQAKAAPARDAPSCLVVDLGEGLEALGLSPEASSVAELSVADPFPRLIPHTPEQITRLDRPVIFVEDTVTARQGAARSGVHAVTVRLGVWVPGDPFLPTRAALRRAQALEQAIANVINGGDAYSPEHVGGVGPSGRGIMRARPSRLVAPARAWETEVGGALMPIAVISPEIEILVLA